MRSQPPTTAAQTEFLAALAEWSGRNVSEFPMDRPPCPGVGSLDEDAILAKVFAEVASKIRCHEHCVVLGIITSAIVACQDRLERVWNAARGAHSGQVAQRRTRSETRQYEAMIAVLRAWHEALFDQMVGVAA